MSSTCFVTQEATKDILIRVTNVCAECYGDIKEGDTIHYDMQNYRYICMSCQDKLYTLLNKNCKPIEDDIIALF